MTDEEIKKLAQEIVALKGGFYVEPENHYRQHERLDRMLNLYDSASNVVLKILIGAAVAGLLFLAATGLSVTK